MHPTRSRISLVELRHVVYQKIFRSYIQFEQSRGLSFEVAKNRGISAFTLFGLLNSGAVTFLIQLSGGPRVSDWMAEHAWAVGAVTIALLGIHWALGTTIQQPPASQAKSSTNGEPNSIRTYLWAWYIGVTFLLWILTSAAVIVHLTSSH
jgi:hypothetical protein